MVYCLDFSLYTIILYKRQYKIVYNKLVLQNIIQFVICTTAHFSLGEGKVQTTNQ